MGKESVLHTEYCTFFVWIPTLQSVERSLLEWRTHTVSHNIIKSDYLDCLSQNTELKLCDGFKLSSVSVYTGQSTSLLLMKALANRKTPLNSNYTTLTRVIRHPCLITYDNKTDAVDLQPIIRSILQFIHRITQSGIKIYLHSETPSSELARDKQQPITAAGQSLHKHATRGHKRASNVLHVWTPPLIWLKS